MSRSRSRPPELNIPLFKNMGILLLVNILPVAGFIYIGIMLRKGKFQLSNPEVLPSLVIPVLFAGLLMLVFWVFLPTAKWMKDYAWWGFNNGNYIVWSLPVCLSFVFWLGVILISLVTAGLMIVSAVYSLANIARVVF